MKKLLVLGGKPIGSCEIVEKAMEKGIYTIVADYLSVEESAAKKVSNEQWEISTADINRLKELCLENKVSAVVTGVHEFNIKRKIELCEELNLSQYCTKKQWDLCENKAQFKKLCSEYGISVARVYCRDDEKIEFPVIVKPVDSSGSRGFSICNNKDELEEGIELTTESGVTIETSIDGKPSTLTIPA